MDADDLDYRTRTLTGCIPPTLVAKLLERGHEQEVEFQAGRAEWFCAQEWARLLGQRDCQEQALEVLAPYVALKWWPAVQGQAELLEDWGRAEEAIALARPYAEAGDRLALEFLGRLLARHGRSGEAFALLRTGVRDWFLARCLVDVAEAAGLDDEAAALLEVRLDATEPACDDPDCGNLRREPFNVIDLLATIRERQGRTDEAIALLRTRETTSVNNRDELAELLARHDRITELRAYAASDDHGHGVQRLAEVLEERGDVDGAVAALRAFGAAKGMWQVIAPLSDLLSRNGRGDEAITVVRAFADGPNGAEDWIVDMLCTLYADHDRPREGLAFLDALKARNGGREDWDFFRMRLPLMAECGLLDEAVEQARAHPEGDSPYADWALSEVLSDAGRTEEAVALLERHPRENSHRLADRLIDLGRIEDAVRVLQRTWPKPPVPVFDGSYSTEPPF
ncbi:tetratricopeptide repeat protein [Streptomyces sp. NPDC057682]|uniref:tetratricopeptide repeat protein n=1 Tax=Streptomyces sp. NPDC057682 TaxID=3346210 RepID=UPI00368237E8